MSDDILLQIIREKENGQSNLKTAKKVGCDISDVVRVLQDTQQIVSSYLDENKTDRDIAYELRLLPDDVDEVITFYQSTSKVKSSKKGSEPPRQIKRVPHSNPKVNKTKELEKNAALVLEAIKNGKGRNKAIYNETMLSDYSISKALSHLRLTPEKARLEALSHSLENGVRSWTELRDNIGYNHADLTKLMKKNDFFTKYNFTLDDLVYKNPSKRLSINQKKKIVLDAIEMGAASRKVIRDITGFPYCTVSKTLNELGKTKESLHLERVESYLAEGGRSLQILCSDLDLEPSGLQKLFVRHNLEKKLNFKYDDFTAYGKNEYANELIAQGEKLQTIATKALSGKTKELARLYVRNSAQYGIWNKGREEKAMKLSKQRENIISTLLTDIIKRAKGDFATEKTIEYIFGARTDEEHYPLKQVQHVFRLYEKMNTASQRLDSHEIAEKTYLEHGGNVTEILQSVGLK